MRGYWKLVVPTGIKKPRPVSPDLYRHLEAAARKGYVTCGLGRRRPGQG